MSEIFRTAKLSTSGTSFYEKNSVLITPTEKQSGNREKLIKQT